MNILMRSIITIVLMMLFGSTGGEYYGTPGTVYAIKTRPFEHLCGCFRGDDFESNEEAYYEMDMCPFFINYCFSSIFFIKSVSSFE